MNDGGYGYSVEIVRKKGTYGGDLPAGDAMERAQEEYLDILREHSPAIAFGPDSFSTRLYVEAWTVPSAITKAEHDVDVAARKVGFPQWPVVQVEATLWDEFERRLEEPTYPEVIGISEIAELAGVTRQRASVLARRSGFPKPLADLASGPIWLRPNVERFIEEWPRTPGRPKSN